MISDSIKEIELMDVKKPNLFWKRLRFLSPLLLIPFGWWLSGQFGYVINVTESLPQSYFIVHLNKTPKVGDYVVFKARNLVGAKEVTLTKKVLGGPGDTVTRQGQDFYINGKKVAKAKTHSLQKEALTPGLEGTLPEGHYYVSGDHEDSLDSRYQKMGWVKRDQCIGVAYPLW